MTPDNNGWSGKPGVPLNPEIERFHWLRSPDGEEFPVLWRPAGECKRGRWPAEWIYDTKYDWPPEECVYLGPSLTPAEVDARVKEARRSALSDTPPGMVLVPRELTDDVRRAVWRAQYEYTNERRGHNATAERISELTEARVNDPEQRESDRAGYHALVKAAGKGEGDE